VGFSDHSAGVDAALCAVARGARAIEKHFTLDKSQKGGDHAHSLDIEELTTLVTKVRLFEEMLGNNQKVITEKEWKERVYARRGIYAARSLKRGELLDFESLRFLRPNISVGVEYIGEVIGRRLARDIPQGDPIDFSMLE
jgi:sialic acid synthase SpsE